MQMDGGGAGDERSWERRTGGGISLDRASVPHVRLSHQHECSACRCKGLDVEGLPWLWRERVLLSSAGRAHDQRCSRPRASCGGAALSRKHDARWWCAGRGCVVWFGVWCGREDVVATVWAGLKRHARASPPSEAGHTRSDDVMRCHHITQRLGGLNCANFFAESCCWRWAETLAAAATWCNIHTRRCPALMQLSRHANTPRSKPPPPPPHCLNHNSIQRFISITAVVRPPPSPLPRPQATA